MWNLNEVIKQREKAMELSIIITFETPEVLAGDAEVGRGFGEVEADG